MGSLVREFNISRRFLSLVGTLMKPITQVSEGDTEFTVASVVIS